MAVDSEKTADQDRRDAISAIAKGGTKARADMEKAKAQQATSQQAAITAALSNSVAQNAPGGVAAELTDIITRGAAGPRDYIPKVGSLTSRYIKGVKGATGDYLGASGQAETEIMKQIRDEESKALLDALAGDGGGGSGGGGGGGGRGGGGGGGSRGGGSRSSSGGGRSYLDDWYYQGGWNDYFGTSKSQGGYTGFKDLVKSIAKTGVDPDTLEPIDVGKRGRVPTSIRRQRTLSYLGEPGATSDTLGAPYVQNNPFLSEGLGKIAKILGGETKYAPSVKEFRDFMRKSAQGETGNQSAGVRYLTTQYAKALKAQQKQAEVEAYLKAIDRQKYVGTQTPFGTVTAGGLKATGPHPRGYAG